MGGRISALDSSLDDVKESVEGIEYTVNSMSNADVFDIRLIQLTSGNTWMLPVASAGWTGN